MMTKQTISFFNIGLLPLLLVSFYMMLPTEVQAKKLFSNAEFSGKVKKKSPVGEGTLGLKYHHSMYASDYDIKITGFFSNDTIYRGSFMGIDGTFKYNIERSKDAFWVERDKSEYFPILTISVMDGTLDGYYNNKSYDVKIIDSPELTISYNNGHHRYDQDPYHITLPELIGVAQGENGDTIYFNLKKCYRRPELEAKWFKVVAPDYVLCRDKDDEVYKFTNGDTAHIGHWGNEGFCIHLNDGATTLSYNRDKKEFTITYPDKSEYIGKLPKIGSLPLDNLSYGDIFEIRSHIKALSPVELQYSNGTLIKPDGQKIKYINGKSEQQIEQERIAEENQRQLENIEYERKQKAEAAAKHRALVSKYGERAANAIENDEPYIGMSEAAFNEIDASYYVYEQTATGTVYAYKTHFVGNHYVQQGRIVQYIVCEHGKIVKIVNL